MTDRELLDLASKAAGIEITWEHGQDFPERVELFRGHLANYEPWDPLNDDGDALQLAGRLHIGVRSHAADHWFHPNLAVALWDFEAKAGRVVVEHGDDPQRAIRRAIVLAAAAIQQATEAK